MDAAPEGIDEGLRKQMGGNKMMKLYCITYGILITLFEAAAAGMARLADRIFWEIDHNDFLSGFVFAFLLAGFAYLAGVIRIGG